MDTWSILKTVAKVAGTATLAVTGTASTILKGVSDAAGVEITSEIFSATKDASFNGIKSMWDDGSDSREETFDKMDEMADSVETSAKRKLADTAYKAAMVAKRNGDEEKYEHYMDKYYEYKDQI